MTAVYRPVNAAHDARHMLSQQEPQDTRREEKALPDWLVHCTAWLGEMTGSADETTWRLSHHSTVPQAMVIDDMLVTVVGFDPHFGCRQLLHCSPLVDLSRAM